MYLVYNDSELAWYFLVAWCLIWHQGISYHHDVSVGTYHEHGCTLIPVWISNDIRHNVSDQIRIHSQTSTMQPLKFENEWKSKFIPHFIMHVITYTCWD